MSRDQPRSCIDDRFYTAPREHDPDAELERYYSDVDLGMCVFCHVGKTRPAIDAAGHQWTRCESCGAQWEIMPCSK